MQVEKSKDLQMSFESWDEHRTVCMSTAADLLDKWRVDMIQCDLGEVIKGIVILIVRKKLCDLNLTHEV